MSNPQIKFKKAKRLKCKASILIEGLSGTGKSGLALAIARVLSPSWDKVFATDTENNSLPLYSGLTLFTGEKITDFNVGDLTEDLGYSPSNYLAFRDLAIQEGAEAIVQDSISHAWQYKGGILDLVTQAQTNKKYNNYTAWGDEKVVAEKNKLLSLIRDSRIHVISTVRIKEKMEIVEGADGKKKIESIGEQQIMQGDIKYEPDLVLRMVSPGTADKAPVVTVIKSRYAPFVKDETYTMNMTMLLQLKRYLEDGADPEELKEEQRLEYVKAVKEFLDAKPNFLPIWQKIKKDAGLEDTKLDDIGLEEIKQLYIKISD